MKIKLQITISLIIFIILTSFILYTLTTGNDNLTTIENKVRIIDEIKNTALDLNYLVNEYSSHGENITIERWNNKFAQFERLIKNLQEEDSSDILTTNDFQIRAQEVNSSFFYLIAHSPAGSTRNTEKITPEIIEYAKNTVEIQTEVFLSRLSQYSAKVKEDAAIVKQKMIMIIFHSIAGMILFVLFVYLVINRTILKTIATFHSATESISAGNLDVHIDRVSNNELGELADAFNKMSIHLKETRSSLLSINEKLNREVQERKNAELALSQKNTELIHAYDNLRVTEEELRDQYEALMQKDNVIQENERRFRAIFAQTFQYIGLLQPDGTIIKVNQTALQLLQIPEENLVGKPFWNTPFWMHSETLQKKLCTGIQEAAGGKFVRFETSHTDREGNEHFVDFSLKPIFDDEQKVTFLLAEGRDIDERKRSETALKRLTNKLSVLHSITMNDIQNAIFSLSGYIELQKCGVDDEKRNQILSSQTRIIGTISDSIKFSKLFQNLGEKPPIWQDITISFLLGISHVDLSQFTKSINLKDVEIYADPLLENVFCALAENVVIHAEGADEISLHYREHENGITIYFEDNGEGILTEDKENIFDRQFGKTKSMGLFLSREILSITDITIHETGEPGKGARFEIYIPRGAYRFKSCLES